MINNIIIDKLQVLNRSPNREQVAIGGAEFEARIRRSIDLHTALITDTLIWIQPFSSVVSSCGSKKKTHM